MKKLLTLWLLSLLVFNAHAQESDSTHKERTRQLKTFLSTMEMVYNARPKPGIDKTVEMSTFNNIFAANTQTKSMPTISAAKMVELCENMEVEMITPSDEKIRLKMEGRIAIDKEFPYADSVSYQEYVIPLALYRPAADSSTMVITDPLFGMRLLFTTDLYTKQKQRVFFYDNMPAGTFDYIRLDDCVLLVETWCSDEHLNITFCLTISFWPSNLVKSGAVHMTAFPADACKCEMLTVPLSKESQGQFFTMDGVKFKLEDFAPGDVLISADTLDTEKIRKWGYITSQASGYTRPGVDKSPYPILCDGLAFGLGSQSKPFAKWLKINGWWDRIVAAKFGASRSDVERIFEGPDSMEFQAYHKLVGSYIALSLLEEDLCKEYSAKNFKKNLLEQYARGKYLPDNNTKYTAGVMCFRMLERCYQRFELTPADFDVIFQSIDKYLADNKSYADDAYYVHHAQICEFQKDNEPVSLTLSDVDYLYAPMPESVEKIDQAIMGLWYKTNVDSDSIIFYSGPKNIDESLWLGKVSCWLATSEIVIPSNSEIQP